MVVQTCTIRCIIFPPFLPSSYFQRYCHQKTNGDVDNDQNILATNCVYNCKAFAVCAAGAAELDPLPPRETFPLLNNTILRAGQSTPLKDAVPLPLSNYTSATFTVSWWAGLPCAGSLHVYTSPDGAHWDTVPRQSFDFVQKKGEAERWQETTAPAAFGGLFLRVVLEAKPGASISAGDVVSTLF